MNQPPLFPLPISVGNFLLEFSAILNSGIQLHILLPDGRLVKNPILLSSIEVQILETLSLFSRKSQITSPSAITLPCKFCEILNTVSLCPLLCLFLYASKL